MIKGGGLIRSVYLATFVYYGASGFFSVRKSRHPRDGMRIGAITAVIGVGLIVAVFTLVDNIFLETVSQQVDKIRGFRQSQYQERSRSKQNPTATFHSAVYLSDCNSPEVSFWEVNLRLASGRQHSSSKIFSGYQSQCLITAYP